METIVNYTVTIEDVKTYKENRAKVALTKSVCDYCAFQQAIQRELPGHRVEMAYGPIIDGKGYPSNPYIASLINRIDEFAEGNGDMPENLPYHGTLTIKS